MTAVDFMFRVEQFQTDDMLLTTCPKCQHHFSLSPCCQGPGVGAGQSLVVTASLHLPPSTTTASATMTVSARRVQVGMTGGGIVHDTRQHSPLILHKGVTSSPVPEPSPSDPIAFVLPAKPWTFPPPETDLERLSSTMRALRLTGWYYEGLSWKESVSLLMPAAPGTFLVRDSSDPRFLFSLSVQTERGPTSVRLHYHEGNFRLDAEPRLVPAMPVFRCVVRLVEYYVSVTGDRNKPARGKEQVWIDCSGQAYSSILLARPLFQKGRFPTLQHLARLAVHRHEVPTGDLPDTLRSYLKEYPYSL